MSQDAEVAWLDLRQNLAQPTPIRPIVAANAPSSSQAVPPSPALPGGSPLDPIELDGPAESPTPRQRIVSAPPTQPVVQAVPTQPVPPPPTPIFVAAPALPHPPVSAPPAAPSGGVVIPVQLATPPAPAPPVATPAASQAVANDAPSEESRFNVSLPEARRLGGQGLPVYTRTTRGRVTTYTPVEGHWCMHCFRTAIEVADGRKEGLSGVIPVCLMGDSVRRCYQCVQRNKICEPVRLFPRL